MNKPLMDIPGYRWDRERERYFKVLKTGELPNSNYTVSALANKDRKSKRTLARQEGEERRQNEQVTHNNFILRLGNRSRIWYNGGPTEIISSFASIGNRLVTGARDGTLACGTWRSDPGRSILDICDVHGIPAVAAVDHDIGSFVGYSAEHIRLKHQFVTQLVNLDCDSDACMGIGSQLGLNVWKPGAGMIDLVKAAGSVSALSKGEGHVVVSGCRNGAIKLIDLRSGSATTTGSLGENRMVTHVATLTTQPALLATGLEDRMMLFDMRKALEPLYEFHGYENWSTSAHGFALSPDSRSVAVALDSGAVDIFDIASGQAVKSLQQSNRTRAPLSTKTARSTVTCIRWITNAMFIATENRIRAFPSGLPRGNTNPSPDQVRELAVAHSNMNLHKTT